MSSKLKLVLLIVLLAGCQHVPIIPGVTPYKIDIQQGNYVTQDMVAKLKPGMTKSQVRFALGTPLVVDPFHNDRWDYVYTLQKGGRLLEHRRIIVLFRDDKLLRMEGDVAPLAKSAEAAGTAARITDTPAVSDTPAVTPAPPPPPQPAAHPAAAAAPVAPDAKPLQ